MGEDVERERLVGAFIEGRVSRRIFIRGLIATGVSVGAALTYAGALSGDVAAAAGRPRAARADLYPPPPFYPEPVVVKLNGKPSPADKGRAVRARIVVKPRSQTTVVGASSPVMHITNVDKAPNAWVVHLKADTSSIPAHTVTVVVATSAGNRSFPVLVPAFSG